MRQSLKLSALSVTALLAAGTAYGQQPPDVVASDGSWNTAMGTEALLSVTPNSCLYCGIENTAAGAYAMQSNTSGGGNVAVGFLAMQFNISGHNNTAVGDSALQGNTSGYYNTAFGSGALLRSTTAYNNTGIGLDALVYNTTGGNNTATGANALFSNITGNANTASGYEALYFNTTAEENTAAGYESLYSNTTGNKNTASGALALVANTTGSYNTASGYQTLTSNTDGIRNTATGDWGLYSNTHGIDNTADGHDALHSNTVGSNNIGLGANAGFNVTSGSNNIEIGNQGTSSDHGTIRVGTSGSQSATYIAGISAAQVTGAAVYITSSGQLGVLASSERYKTEVAPMGASTEKLQALRPVSFHLKADPNGTVQYGLIAEEVDKVYPELVIRDAAGRIQGVRYEELGAMLLNEVQKQRRMNETQASEIRDLKNLMIEMQAGLLKLQTKDARVAQR
jgi:hypothetical protein